MRTACPHIEIFQRGWLGHQHISQHITIKLHIIISTKSCQPVFELRPCQLVPSDALSQVHVASALEDVNLVNNKQTNTPTSHNNQAHHTQDTIIKHTTPTSTPQHQQANPQSLSLQTEPPRTARCASARRLQYEVCQPSRSKLEPPRASFIQA